MEGRGIQGVMEILATRGLCLRREWVGECVQGVVEREGQLPVDVLAERCFAQVLIVDLNVVGTGVLPPGVQSLHKVELPGPYVLQIDEISDIVSPTLDRYHERNAGVGTRCLKLSMTDGVQRVYGIEYRPIPQLKVLSPAGLKIAVGSVCVRRGLFLLVPDIVVVLGGVVEDLETARRKVLEKVNRPPRGNRNPHGVAPSLAEQLTVAAWQQAVQQNLPQTAVEHERPQLERSQPFEQSQRQTQWPNDGIVRPPSQPIFEAQPAQTPQQPIRSSQTATQRQDVQAPQRVHQNPSASTSESILSRTNQASTRKLSLSQQTLHAAYEKRQSSQVAETSTRHNDAGTLTLPFTYLALLQKRFSESGVTEAGRIKCVLTGVKEFHFRNLDMFQLVVYIDDGSLISEALMDHQLVQKLAGYSPGEVTAALDSEDREVFNHMKSKIKDFQEYLAKFQGYADVEYNRKFKVLNIHHSVPSRDVWLLLNRVQNRSQPTRRIEIELSP